MIKWFKDKPPHEGWWLTRMDKLTSPTWRWWSGERWSLGFLEGVKPSMLAQLDYLVTISAVYQDFEWSTYYPEKPTVPRLDPTGLKQEEVDHFYSQAAHLQDAVHHGYFIYVCGPMTNWHEWKGGETLGHPRYSWLATEKQLEPHQMRFFLRLQEVFGIINKII